MLKRMLFLPLIITMHCHAANYDPMEIVRDGGTKRARVQLVDDEAQPAPKRIKLADLTRTQSAQKNPLKKNILRKSQSAPTLPTFSAALPEHNHLIKPKPVRPYGNVIHPKPVRADVVVVALLESYIAQVNGCPLQFVTGE